MNKKLFSMLKKTQYIKKIKTRTTLPYLAVKNKREWLYFNFIKSIGLNK